MKEIHLRTISSFHFGDKLLVAISDKFMKANKGEPLTFSAKINEKNQLVLSAALPTLDDKTIISGEIDGSN